MSLTSGEKTQTILRRILILNNYMTLHFIDLSSESSNINPPSRRSDFSSELTTLCLAIAVTIPRKLISSDLVVVLLFESICAGELVKILLTSAHSQLSLYHVVASLTPCHSVIDNELMKSFD
jgi:hypothetical protein